MDTWYCPLPFRHAYVDSTGVSACCQTPRYRGSIDQWLNSEPLKKLQQQILQGVQPKSCYGCVAQEKTLGRSLRTDSVADYHNQRFESTNIDFVDYRATNICNFKCRTCNPMFSHGIAQEAMTVPALAKFFNAVQSKTVAVSESNIEWIDHNLHQIRRLMLTGGEPTYNPQLKTLCEKIVYDGLDIEIMITTNAGFVDDFWCELTRLSNRVHWTVSLDGVDSVAKIVRHGTKWPVVERNVRWLVQHAHSLNFNTVVSNLNILHLKPLLQFVLEMQNESKYPRGKHGDQGCRHQFHVCQRPYHLAADNWPQELRPRVLHQLSQCLSQDLDQEQRRTIQGLIDQITSSEFDNDLWQHSLHYNQLLDQHRQENHQTLYN